MLEPIQTSAPVGPQGGPSFLTAKGGVRQMKCYAVTEDELEQLGLLQGGSTAAFSMASALIGFIFSVTQNLAFAAKIPPEIASYWAGLRMSAIAGAILFLLVGIALVILGRSKVARVKRDTIH